MALKMRTAGDEDGPADEVLRKLMDDEVWAAHFAACRKEGAEKLIAEAGRYADALHALGHEHGHRDVERALLAFGGYAASDVSTSARPPAAEELGTAEHPGGCSSEAHQSGWDVEWEGEVFRSALQYITEHVGDVNEAMDLAAADAASDAMDAAAEAGDREAYLRAARRWASAWRRAAERVRGERKSGPDEAAGKEER
ncbi:MAG: hypothetical protein M3P49_07410 [Actinomycetota bacterium]|nr:hypothetical protein [Actinomycetota bacterium]